MGCDIHLCIEIKDKGDTHWSTYAQLFLSRNYTMFGYMANVRTHPTGGFIPKGYPVDMNPFTAELLQVKLEWVHSGSWLTGDQFVQIFEDNEWLKEEAKSYHRLVDLFIRSFHADGYDVRFVFNFDS